MAYYPNNQKIQPTKGGVASNVSILDMATKQPTPTKGKVPPLKDAMGSSAIGDPAYNPASPPQIATGATFDPNPGNYSGSSFMGRGGGSGGFDGDSSIGGISAVNPQADMDYQGYVDQTYNALTDRLNPVFEQNRDAFDQSMINRGIPVGSEAYNETLQQMQQGENDAYTQAGLQAMGFGADLQNQMFGQDATRSQLANALLQSRWNTDLGYDSLDARNNQFFAGLDENARQYDQGLGYRYDAMDNDMYKFDSTLDYNYWNDDNRYDYMWDRAGADDYRWAAGQDRQDYYDQRSAGQYDDALLMSLLGMNAPASPYYQDPSSAYGNQMSNLTNQQNNNMGFLSNLFFGG